MQKMKAQTLFGVGDLRWGDVDLPRLKEGEVLVKVVAVGICSSDIPRAFVKGTYHFPTIMGHEFSGQIVDVADEDDKNLINNRVGVFPLIPCKQCEMCKIGKYEMCEKYNYLGSRCNGAFAQYIAVPKWNTICLPPQVTFEQAALLEPSAVAMHALQACAFQQDDRIGVFGSGAIAFLLVMLAQALDIENVWLIARNDEKRELAEKCGIKHYINSSKENCSLLNFNKVIEAVGNSSVLDECLNTVKPQGTVVLMGNPDKDMVLNQNTYWKILRNQLKLKGTWNSSYEYDANCEWQQILRLIEVGKLHNEKIITHFYQLNKLKEGMIMMRDKKEKYLKVMVRIDEE
ncbi:MAG: galactitol-1-phosphate 5-dehydrogenase [Clostridia bacterium]